MEGGVTRVLFVDDAPAVLEGLENRLRKLGGQWSMRFASGAQEALAQLAEEPFDVVVTDSRLAGLGGSRLLELVRQEHPATIRIVLTGEVERAGALRPLAVAHQVLGKPCNATELEQAVERVSVVRPLLEDEAVRSVVTGIRHLPVLPKIYRQLTDALADPEVGMDDVASLIEQDVAITARLLQFVNSAIFGLNRDVRSVKYAASYLGLDALQSLVLSLEIFQLFDSSQAPQGFSMSALQAHSLRVAQVAKQLFDEHLIGSAVFSAAMLHDVGRMALASAVKGFYEPVIALAASEEIPLGAAEERVHGFTHADVGAYLLALWGLPAVIVEAVAHHHHPRRAGKEAFDLIGALHVADQLAQEHELQCTSLDLTYLDAVGVADQLGAWRSRAGEI